MIVKLKSIKNLLLIWIVSIITYTIVTNRLEWLPFIENLSWAILSYYGANIIQKYIYKDKGDGK